MASCSDVGFKDRGPGDRGGEREAGRLEEENTGDKGDFFNLLTISASLEPRHLPILNIISIEIPWKCFWFLIFVAYRDAPEEIPGISLQTLQTKFGCVLLRLILYFKMQDAICLESVQCRPQE